MERTALVNSFCSVMKDFLGDMYKSYPDNSLMMLQQATSAMMMTHPLGVVQNFMICVDVYVEKILTKDDSFFLDGGLEKDLSGGEYSFLLEELKKIAVIWKDPTTSKKTKESIWKYLQVLVKVGKKVVVM